MEVGIALGSNLGDRLRHLREAVEAIRPHLAVDAAIEKSPVYATEPVDCPLGSGHFYNAVIVVQFDGAVEQLLTITQGIENACGRPDVEARAVNAPREIDLDLLYAGSENMSTDKLVLPHPCLSHRRFVLEPLAWIRPDLVLPNQKYPVKALLDALQSDEPPLDWVTGDW